MIIENLDISNDLNYGDVPPYVVLTENSYGIFKEIKTSRFKS